MVFLNRAAIIALVTFASALLGFGVQALLPFDYVAASKGMIGSVVGLDASLLALVLGLLIWTAHGQFTAQVAQLQTISRALVLLDLSFVGYGAETEAGRLELRAILDRTRKRLWIDDRKGRRGFNYSHLAGEILPMRDVLFGLRPADADQRQHLAAARDHFGTIVDTELTMLRSLVNPVPKLLLTIVVGWACLLFFCYALTAAINLLTTIMAALGALSVASAAYLILELSDPYVGLFKMPQDVFDGLMKTLTPLDLGAPSPGKARPAAS
jgi:hypothetical protein